MRIRQTEESEGLKWLKLWRMSGNLVLGCAVQQVNHVELVNAEAELSLGGGLDELFQDNKRSKGQSTTTDIQYMDLLKCY